MRKLKNLKDGEAFRFPSGNALWQVMIKGKKEHKGKILCNSVATNKTQYWDGEKLVTQPK